MTTNQRAELISDLVEKTKISWAYYNSLSDERLLEEFDKIGLIY